MSQLNSMSQLLGELSEQKYFFFSKYNVFLEYILLLILSTLINLYWEVKHIF